MKPQTTETTEPVTTSSAAASAAAESEAPRPRDEVPYTQAELSFMLAQAKRQKDRVKKAAEKTHREKIEEFNRKLSSLSEHYDVPKVGPG